MEQEPWESDPPAPEVEASLFSMLKQALGRHVFLGPKDLVLLFSIIRFRTLRKGEHIVRVGEHNYHALMVLRGLLRNYIIDEEGVERTILFVPERMNAGSSETILHDRPSVENIVALENSFLATADLRKFDQLARSRPALLRYHNQILKELLAAAIDQSWFHLLMRPEKRYLEFCRRFPKLEQRVTQRDLASYLGVTPTSLSRMRARIAQS